VCGSFYPARLSGGRQGALALDKRLRIWEAAKFVGVRNGGGDQEVIALRQGVLFGSGEV
jgi:hypothetical protein